MTAFQLISSDSSRSRGKYVTLDKFGRLMLSANLRDSLHTKGVPIRLQVALDPENKRIALQKPELVRKSTVNVEPFKFDVRGYSPAKSVLEKFALPTGQTYKFTYAGDEFIEGERWLSFEFVKR
jgi:hypothetical protein